MNREEMRKDKGIKIKSMRYKAIYSITGLSKASVRWFCRIKGFIGVSAIVTLNLEEKIKKNELYIYY